MQIYSYNKSMDQGFQACHCYQSEKKNPNIYELELHI